MPANLENSAVATGLEKVSFHSSQRKAMPKNAQTTAQLHSSHMLVKLKILQARLQQYVNHELPDVQAGFRKGRGTRDQIASIHWHTVGCMCAGMNKSSFALKQKTCTFAKLVNGVNSCSETAKGVLKMRASAI